MSWLEAPGSPGRRAGETATEELARRVLRYLYRARFDPELRFETVNR